MFNANKPDASELPSSRQLLKSTGIAAVIASVLLVTTVLPAEYGVDPTGVGSLLGLTEMGRIKMSLAEEAKAEEAADAAVEGQVPPLSGAPLGDGAAPLAEPVPAAPAPAPAATVPSSVQPAAPAATSPRVSTAASDESVFTLAPDAGFEIKLVMKKGAKANFLWFTDGPGVNYDTHGDGAGINYHGYAKGTNTPRLKGELVAAFDGSHGWFWRNRTDADVKITLRTSGDYSDVKQYD